ncbi:MAG: DUF2079 domain-containing protein [Patescibacteria group bacterium]|jgi:uncharacterized membrane protein
MKKNNSLTLHGFLTLLKKNWDIIVVGILIVAYALVLSKYTILRHESFNSNYDLANMDQTVWSTLNGRFFSLTSGSGVISRFAIHADLMLALLSPIYLIWNNVRMLLITQSVILALGAIPTYLLAQKVLKQKIPAVVIVILYLLNPGMQWTNMYDFHAVSLAIPLLISVFYFAYSRRWTWFTVFVFLALITKEEISLFIVMIGLYLTVFSQYKKIGALTVVAGALWFYVTVFIVIPHFSPNNAHWAFSWYNFSDSGKDIFTSTSNRLLDSFLKAPDVWTYYVNLLKPFIFLPLVGFPFLILALPELIINIISTHAQMRSTFFHYDSGVTPALVIAAIFGVFIVRKILSRLVKQSAIRNILFYLFLFLTVVGAVRVNYHHSPLPSTPSTWQRVFRPDADDIAFEKVLQTIPQSASITASSNVRPHLTHRLTAYTMPDATSSADFVAVLTEERIVGNYQPIDVDIVAAMSISPEHELVSNIGKFYLFKRKDFITP